jgi:hypothetical protein
MWADANIAWDLDLSRLARNIFTSLYPLSKNGVYFFGIVLVTKE